MGPAKLGVCRMSSSHLMYADIDCTTETTMTQLLADTEADAEAKPNEGVDEKQPSQRSTSAR